MPHICQWLPNIYLEPRAPSWTLNSYVHCLLDISPWRSNCQFNIIATKMSSWSPPTLYPSPLYSLPHLSFGNSILPVTQAKSSVILQQLLSIRVSWESCLLCLQRIPKFWLLLITSFAAIIVQAIIISHLGCFSSLLTGVSAATVAHL